MLDPLGGASSLTATDRDREACRASFAKSLRAATAQETPYRHWLLDDVLPGHVAAAMDEIPFAAPPLDGVSGSREIHNNPRRYVDQAAIAEYPACRSLADAFQDPATVAVIEEVTGARIDGCCLRIEYAQDTDGFWLQPHTDLGVKKFTLLYYLGPDGQPDLGTDVLPRRRHLVAPRAIRAGRGAGLRAIRQHLARLRAAADPGGAQVADRQLRHRSLDGPRAAGLSGQAGDRPQG